MVQTLEYLALRGSFDWETARTLKMSSRAQRIRSTQYARQVQVAVGDAGPHLRREMGLGWPEPVYTSTPISVPEARDKPGMSQLLKRTTLAGKVSNMKSLSLGEAATRFGINDLPIIFHDWIAHMWCTKFEERIVARVAKELRSLTRYRFALMRTGPWIHFKGVRSAYLFFTLLIHHRSQLYNIEQ